MSSGDQTRYGVGEWFGELLADMSPARRQKLLDAAKDPSLGKLQPCPFRVAGKTCSKEGGVCSLRQYTRKPNGEVKPSEGQAGLLASLCPHRFEEGGLVVRWVGEVLLSDDAPDEVVEVPFLRGLARADTGDLDGAERAVGRIDSVLVSRQGGTINWCALEVQAVYFSGRALSKDFGALGASTPEIPFPTGIRRPDYRSSGPKRLMPQLQTKVPTLRRWGRKMAVLVDESFFGALGEMNSVNDVSNCDIAWFVVGFDIVGARAVLSRRRVHLTTLEDAVVGLTAGTPLTKDEFEAEILKRLRGSGGGDRQPV